LPIDKAEARVVDLAGEYTKILRLPAYSLEELLQVRIRFGRILLGFTGYYVDREKRVRVRFEDLLVASDVIVNERPVLAIANARADDDLVERTGFERRVVFEICHAHFGTRALEPLLDTLADLYRMAVGGGIYD